MALKHLFACCRVRAAGGGVPRGGVPRRRRRHVPPRRLPLLPHPRTTAAGPPPPLTSPTSSNSPSHPDPPSRNRASPAPRVIHIDRASDTLGKGRFGRIALSLPRGGGDTLVNIG